MPVADALASRFRVLVPDLPGYGRSPALASPTIESVGDAIAEMLHERGVSDLVAVAGFSTGSYRALDLVLRHAPATPLVISLAGVACFDDEVRSLRRSLADELEADPGLMASAKFAALMPALMLGESWKELHPEDIARVEAWLEITRDLVDAFSRGSTEAIELVPVTERGVPEQFLALVREDSTDARHHACVSACARRWSLTVRQAEVLALAARGLTNTTIAAELRVGERSVEHHMTAIFDAAGVDGRAALVAKVLTSV